MLTLNGPLQAERDESGLSALPLGVVRVYAIAFDLDTETMKSAFGESSYTSGYHQVRRILEDEGFTWMQGTLYYGNEKTDPVKCVLVIQRCARQLPWFGDAVRDIRMLRIEENNDLRPAIPQPELPLH
jgi:virulence-associated protein VapD